MRYQVRDNTQVNIKGELHGPGEKFEVDAVDHHVRRLISLGLIEVAKADAPRNQARKPSSSKVK